LSQIEAAGLSDELRRLVVERTHDLVTMIEPDGTIVFASKAWEDVLGYRPDEVVGTSIVDYTHPDDVARGTDAIATQAAGAETAPIVTRRRTKDGRWLSIESSSLPVFDGDGNVTHIIGSARDVTESEELRLRVRELDALYRVADAVARTADLDTLFAAALDALIDATAADRASLLLADAGGVMHFRAWRGLSDEYRAATDGHSPWPADAVDPEPVLVADAQAAGFEPPLDAALERERIGALAFVPLVHAGRLLGKFMLYTAAPHTWEERDIRLCRNVANHLASATVRTEATAAVRSSREQLETIMATVDEGIIVQAPDFSRLYANDAAARASGIGTEELVHATADEVTSQFELLAEDGTALDPGDLPGRLAFDGRTHERVVHYRKRDGSSDRWSLIRANPVRGENGDVVATVSVMHDITERRASEHRAREAAALVESLFLNAPVGLAFWDRDLRYQRVNEQLVQINGIPAEEHIGRNVFEVFPQFEGQLDEILRGVLETGEPYVGQEVVGETPAAPGELRVYRASWFPVRADDGTILGVGGVVDEITSERRAEERVRFLARAGELLNRTLDSADTLGALAGVAVPDFAGHVTVDLFVDGVLRCVGARHVDPEKTELMRRLREQYPPTVENHPVQRALATGEPQFVPDVQAEAASMAHDAEHAAAIGRLANESGIVVPLIARGVTFGAITFGTVAPQPRFGPTDLALAAELAQRAAVALDNSLLYEQAQARAHAADALEFVDDGVFLVDSEEIVRLWNPTAARTFRVRANRAIGRHVGESIRDWETFADRVASARRSETLPIDVEGEERWISATAARFAGGTVYAFRDLTQEHAIEQLRSDFVSTVSHELRTPLAAIYGAALTLQRADVRLEESQRTGLLDVIASEADRLARIVNDILWASRLDSGQMGIAIERCDAAALSARVVEAIRMHAPETVQLAVDTEPGLPPVAADPDKLRQVLTNLVDNAIKYSPDGGRVEVGITRRDHAVRFRVADRGLGIPLGEQRRIFDKFYRVDPNLTRGVGGTGLGLYICRELVRRMNGTITVESREGEGSSFSFELPVATT
jgi:PAS domain S-box-containing protein